MTWRTRRQPSPRGAWSPPLPVGDPLAEPEEDEHYEESDGGEEGQHHA